MSRKTRKLIWSAPLVAVLAVAGALAIFAAVTPGSVFAHDPPDAVVNLTGEADGTNAIDLSWDAPGTGGTPTSYRIDRSLDGNAWMTRVMDHTTRTYSDTGLDPGSNYYYRVFAVNSAGTGPVSQDYQVQTDVGTPPSAVVRLTATAMGQNQVNLSWMAPAELGGSLITKYSIHFASGDTSMPVQAETATNAGVIEVDVEDGRSYQHKKLDANTRYRYIVYAHNGPVAIDKSTMPSDIAAATTAPLVKPRAPTGVTAVQTEDRAFTLYWYAPTETGGTPVIDYEVHVSYNGGLFTELALDWRGSTDTVSVDAVDPTVPPDDGGSPATAYTTVRYQVYAITRNADGSATPPIKELKSTGYGQSATMTLLADMAARDAAIPAVPLFADANASRDPKGNVDLEWTAPAIDGDDNDLTNNNAPDSIGGYRIDVSDDGMSWRRLINHTRKTATEYQYVDEEREDRHYRIFAWHAQYLGPAQALVAVSSLDTGDPVAPGHVASFTATAMGPAQIGLAWTAPENDGGAPIVRYQIAGVRQAGDTFAAFPTVATTDDGMLFTTSKTTGYMHKKLNAGETWQYQVLTVTDDGAEEVNSVRMASVTTAESRMATTHQAALPEAPEGLVAEDAKDSSNTGASDRGVLLLWNAPNPPDGAAVDGYRIQRKKGDAAWETLESDTNNMFTDYTDTAEPEAGELRQYRVAALNGSKIGAYSMVAYYPHALTMHNTAPMTVGMIAPVTVTAGEMSDAMYVSGYFSDADTGDTLTYTASSDMEIYATADIPAGSSMLTITGVAAGMATITVTATDAAGAMATQAIMVTVEAANTPPMAEGMIAPVTVTAGEMSDAMDVSAYFSDADMGDTLKYTAMSDMEMYATASVSGSMVTITGVAAGTATITVTATDMDDATATQEIMVTVEAASMELIAPTGVSGSLFAGSSIIVSWDADSAQNADLIVVALFNEGVTALANIPKNTHPINLDAMADPGTYSFNNVPSGTYKVAVASESGGVYKVSLAAEVVTVP